MNRTRTAQPAFWLRSVPLSLVFLLLTCLPAVASEAEDLWQALRSGEHVALLRHALAPGTGDPAGFVLDDCRTQRNLSAAGQQQARRIGELFRGNGITSAGVFSSQWCRCLKTARLLELGPVEELPIINSFFQAFHRKGQQTEQLTEWLRERDLSRPLVLVTHQVNITALAGVYPSSGELVVLRRGDAGRLSVVGTLETE